MEEAKVLVRSLFKNSQGNPFEMTDGQSIIFVLVTSRKFPRLQIETFTRYGKSDILSMAGLIMKTQTPGKLAIVAGNKEKATIIMGYAIGHIFDNAGIRKKFIIEKTESEENIRRYRNKTKINFDLGNGKLGEMFICSAPDALGWGAPDVIEDESGLVKTNEHALVMRMLGDQPDNFLGKVGNPWPEEHFIKSFEDPEYKKVIIDYKIGIKEGRILPAYVDEMRKQPFFDVLYECKFPKSGIIDEKGWVPLITRDEIKSAMIDPVDGFGVKKLGVDVAGGGRNFSVIVKRYTNIAKIALRNQDPDTMNLAESTISMMNKRENWKYDFYPEDVGIDSVGMGKGVYDIVNRQCPGVWGINGADKPTDLTEEQRFVNLRAELFWKAREWILKGGKLESNESWYELAKIKYRTKLQGTKGKMQIISKEEMLKDGIQSPDCADAFSMTFRSPDLPHQDEYDLEREKKMEKFDPFDPFPNL